LNAHHRISPAEGIAGHVGPAVGVKYAIGCTNNRLLPVLRGTFNVEYFNTPDL
jgi:beta-glucosidase